MILLADDDASLRTLGQRILESRGYEVLTACDGREALDTYCQHREKISLCILDISMPEMDGDEVLHHIRQKDPSAAVLLCTGHDISLFAERLERISPTGLISKPYHIADLIDAVQSALPQGEC